MTRLVLWRHGQTEWNAAGRFQGQIDVELSDTGRVQAQAAAVRLAALRPDLIFSSDLRRAADTAAALGSVTGLPVHHDVRLRERNFGLWQGQQAADIQRTWPELYAAWRAGELGGPAERDAGIETVEEVVWRMDHALRDILGKTPVGGTVVITTHGGAARHAVGALLGWPASVSGKLRGLRNGHWSELRLDSDRGWLLGSYNVGHVEPEPAR